MGSEAARGSEERKVACVERAQGESGMRGCHKIGHTRDCSTHDPSTWLSQGQQVILPTSLNLPPGKLLGCHHCPYHEEALTSHDIQSRYSHHFPHTPKT